MDGAGAAGASIEGVPPVDLYQVSEEPSKVTGEQGMDPSTDEANPATDHAVADVAPPAKRKSHRPSLEVVEVKVESFYDKGDFKQELQVGRSKTVFVVPLLS